MLKFYPFDNMYCMVIVTAKLMGKTNCLNPSLGNLATHILQNRIKNVLSVGRFLMKKRVLIHTDSFPGIISGFTYSCESLTQTHDSFSALFPCGYWQCTMYCHGEIRRRCNTLSNKRRNIGAWLLSHLLAESLSSDRY